MLRLPLNFYRTTVFFYNKNIFVNPESIYDLENYVAFILFISAKALFLYVCLLAIIFARK